MAQGALSGSHSRALIVTGMAPPTQPVNITVKSDLNLATPPTLANNVATTRAGNVFSYRLPISIGSSAAEWLSVSVNSSGGSPINNAQTLGNRYIAPTNQSPTYDEDGNLASDARWI